MLPLPAHTGSPGQDEANVVPHIESQGHRQQAYVTIAVTAVAPPALRECGYVITVKQVGNRAP